MRIITRVLPDGRKITDLRDERGRWVKGTRIVELAKESPDNGRPPVDPANRRRRALGLPSYQAEWRARRAAEGKGK